MHPKQPDVSLLLADLQRQWGTHALRLLAELAESTPPSALPTGFPALDSRLICSGVPRGRLTVFSGRPTSGATSLAYHLMAQAQRDCQGVVYLDLCACFDPLYARRCHVDLDGLLLIRPADVQEALALLRDLVEEDTPLLAVLDGLLLKSSLPDLRALRAVLPRSALTLLFLLPPILAATSGADVHLLIERQTWLYQRRDVRGYRAAVTVTKDLGMPAGARVEIDIVP